MTILQRLQNWFGSSDTPKAAGADEEALTPEAIEPVGPDVGQFLCEAPAGDLRWSQFHDSVVLRTWADDLQRARESGDPDDWQMAGPSLALECEDQQALQLMLSLVAAQAGFGLARVPDGSLGGLIPGLRGHFAGHAPLIVMITEDAIRQTFSEDPELSLRTFVRASLLDFDPASPVVLVMTTSSVAELPSDLCGLGLFDRQIVVAPPPREVLGRQFLDSIGADHVSDELRTQAAKVGLFLRRTWSTAEARELACVQLKRRARRDGRALHLDDLLDLSLRGAAERNPSLMRTPTPEQRRKVAYHEAGHACIAVIDSQGRAVPDYASIVPAQDFAGVVMHSLHYWAGLSEEFTFADLLLRVRVSLAGRAAEELFFGSLSVSDGADSDLESATRSTYAYFAQSGFHPTMVNNGVSGMNLAVQVDKDAHPVQNDRIITEVRSFLSDQYAHVMRVLQDHRPFVDAVVDRLMWDPVVDQDEMAAIARAHGLMVLQPHEPAQQGATS
jgi:hypothetical protein